MKTKERPPFPGPGQIDTSKKARADRWARLFEWFDKKLDPNLETVLNAGGRFNVLGKMAHIAGVRADVLLGRESLVEPERDAVELAFGVQGRKLRKLSRAKESCWCDLTDLRKKSGCSQ